MKIGNYSKWSDAKLLRDKRLTEGNVPDLFLGLVSRMFKLGGQVENSYRKHTAQAIHEVRLVPNFLKDKSEEIR